MPIKGITDRSARLPQIGTLRKGAAKAQNRPGRDLDYFRFDAAEEPELEKTFTRVFGATPKIIPCFLPYRTPAQNLRAFMYQFGASGMKRKCDGERIWSDRQADGSMMHYTENQMPACLQTTDGCQCKPSGQLHIIIPALGRYGVTLVQTTSVIDIATLSQTLDHLFNVAQQYGHDLTSMPMQLARFKTKKRSPIQGGKYGFVTRSFLRLEILPQWFKDRLIESTSSRKMIAMSPDEEIYQALPAHVSEEEKQSQEIDAIESAMNPPAMYPAQVIEEESVTVAPGQNDALKLVQLCSEWLDSVGFGRSADRSLILTLIMKRKVTTVDEMSADEIHHVITCLDTMRNKIDGGNQNHVLFAKALSDALNSGEVIKESYDFLDALMVYDPLMGFPKADAMAQAVEGSKAVDALLDKKGEDSEVAKPKPDVVTADDLAPEIPPTYNEDDYDDDIPF